MKAALVEKFGEPLTVVDNVELAAPAPDEVRVRVVASGVCHSDRTMQNGAWPLTLPMIPGHEPAGVVEEVGSAVTSIHVGDHVVGAAQAFCGECSWCMRGLLHHCIEKRRTRPAGQDPRMTWQGRPTEGYTGLGGFAEQMLVTERALITVPKEMPFDAAALLGCAVITGVGVIRYRAKVAFGETVAVVGCGGVGLNAVQAARMAGASRIIAVDLNPAKLELARTFGATDVIDASRVNPVEAVRDLTGGGVDHSIEVVGLPRTIEQSFAMLGIRGTCTVVGVTMPGAELNIPAEALLMGEKRLQGCRSGTSRFRLDIPLYCQMYLDGRLLLDELVAAHIGLDQVNEALAEMDGASAHLRHVVMFKSELGG